MLRFIFHHLSPLHEARIYCFWCYFPPKFCGVKAMQWLCRSGPKCVFVLTEVCIFAMVVTVFTQFARMSRKYRLWQTTKLCFHYSLSLNKDNISSISTRYKCDMQVFPFIGVRRTHTKFRPVIFTKTTFTILCLRALKAGCYIFIFRFDYLFKKNLLFDPIHYNWQSEKKCFHCTFKIYLDIDMSEKHLMGAYIFFKIQIKVSSYLWAETAGCIF